MSSVTRSPKKGAALPYAAKKARISPALRHGIALWVEEGLTQDKAREAAGLSNAGWFKAMKRPAVQQYVEQVKVHLVKRVEAMKAPYKALALEHGKHLMLNASSEAVQARMVEFFAGEPKNQGQNVAVQVNIDRSGYEYAPPGARVVEIVQDQGLSHSPTDAQSDEQDDQATD